MNLTKKPAEYTLTLTHEELLLLETITYEWSHRGVRPTPPDVRLMQEDLAKAIERAGIKARGGVA